MEPLRLRLLGRPEVSRGGRPLVFRSRKELALLFYLVTEGGVHPRERLAALLWPESGEALARLREARALAEEIGLPGELWQIWAALGELYEQRGKPEEAHGAFSRAASIVERLAGEIEDEALKEGFLSAPQLRRVLEASAHKP